MDPNVSTNSSSSPPSPASKRLKLEDESPTKTNNSFSPIYNPQEICTFGEKCYRRNIHHFREYRHVHLEQLYDQMSESKNLNQLPQDYVPTLDKSLIIDQVNILKDAGYIAKKLIKVVVLESDSDSDSDCKLIDSPSTSSSRKLPLRKRITASSSQTTATSPTSYKRKQRSICPLSPVQKWEASAPFHMFLTSIGPEKTFFSMGFADLFDKEFGEVSQVCHVNFMVEMEWLMDQIVTTTMWGKPTTIIYGAQNPQIEKTASEFDWMDSYKMKSPYTYGHHHTKMSLIEYEDHSIRFVIYTANLIEADWLNKTQGMWISPKCPAMPSKDPSGESPTGFRADILAYLATYQLKLLENWINLINCADCSQIKVVLVASAPNLSQSGGATNGFRWGVKKMETVLKQHQTAPIDSKWPLIVQCSSLGSLGPDETWLNDDFASLLEGPKKPFAAKPPVKLVYPCVVDVKESAQGKEGADCLPYSNSVHIKQPWIERHMCKWVGFRHNRTYALPHIKTYCRVSPDYQKMAWFVLTSANLSKAAWGKLNKKRDQLMVMSWECGVLFLPKFLTGTDSFEGKIEGMDSGSAASDKISIHHQTVGYPFPIPYDLPIHPYSGDSKPWLVEYLGHPRR